MSVLELRPNGEAEDDAPPLAGIGDQRVPLIYERVAGDRPESV
jgi:hypothetical protein